VEDAIWSARRDTSTGYGIAVFDVEPASAETGGQASIKVTHYHAVGADPVNPATGVKGAPTPTTPSSRRSAWCGRAHPEPASGGTIRGFRIPRDTVGSWMFS
jgi:hypothetical protein